MSESLNRRGFLATAAAGAALASTTLPARAARRPHNAVPESATAWVQLGETGLKMPLLGMGTGSAGVGNASNQTKLGLKEFCRVARHAYDSGVRFFDVADQYGSHTYVREALKGLPRDSYVIQTKTHANDFATARSHLERFRLELGVEYIDILLLHCMTTADWPKQKAGAMEYFAKAKEEGLVRTHGVSNHGMDPLRTSAQHPFVLTNLARINPENAVMDGQKVDEVASELEEMHEAGKGVIGMKIFGEGRFKEAERRDASLRFVFGLGTVDAITVGLESVEQVDDLIARTDRALKFLREQKG